MIQFPPFLEKLLTSLGVNTNRLKWKIHYWQQDRARRRAAAANMTHGRRYKACRHCGELALAEDKVCKCGRRLPSYTAYRIGHALALDKPEVTYVSGGLIGAILGFFAWQIIASGPGALFSPTMESSHVFGAFAGAYLSDGQIWRILTMALVHFGVLHVLFNVLAISQLLPAFESDIGTWRALVLVTVTQIAAALAHAVWYEPLSPTVGASGIAFGLIGFGLAYAHRQGNRELRGFFLHWFIYGTVFSLMFRFNNAAHTGGFLAGLPLGYWMGGARPRGVVKTLTQALGVACVLLWLYAVILLIGSILTGGGGGQ